MTIRNIQRSAAALCALVLVAAACGGDDDDGAAEGEPAACEVDETDGDLAIYNWAEYID